MRKIYKKKKVVSVVIIIDRATDITHSENIRKASYNMKKRARAQ